MRARSTRSRPKYIFGNFTVGSAIGIEGEKAIEPDTEVDLGKRAGRYGVAQTELEFEYTPTQYFQIEVGPTVSYYNIRGVPGLDDRNIGGINGFEADFRSLFIDRGPTPFAVTVSIEPELHSLDETSGASVSNYGVETKLEADAELIKNRLFLGFQPPLRARDNPRSGRGLIQRIDLRGVVGACISDLPEGRDWS